jgi:hypothetical protein
MIQIYGIDDLAKVIALGSFGENANSPGQMPVRQIIKGTDKVVLTAVGLATPISTKVVTITMPAGAWIYEIKFISFWWDTGTVTINSVEAGISGINMTMLKQPALAANNLMSWTGSIFLLAADTIFSTSVVTVAGANLRLFVQGVRHPLGT